MKVRHARGSNRPVPRRRTAVHQHTHRARVAHRLHPKRRCSRTCTPHRRTLLHSTQDLRSQEDHAGRSNCLTKEVRIRRCRSRALHSRTTNPSDWCSTQDRSDRPLRSTQGQSRTAWRAPRNMILRSSFRTREFRSRPRARWSRSVDPNLRCSTADRLRTRPRSTRRRCSQGCRDALRSRIHRMDNSNSAQECMCPWRVARSRYPSCHRSRMDRPRKRFGSTVVRCNRVRRGANRKGRCPDTPRRSSTPQTRRRRNIDPN